jgi:hypothetical protein
MAIHSASHCCIGWGLATPFVEWLDLLSPKSHHNNDRPHDNDDDFTSTDASKEDNASMRKSYLEALLQ